MGLYGHAMLLGAVMIGLPLAGVAQSTAPVEGVWRTQSGTEVTIAPCGGDLCGHITKIVVPEDIYRANQAALDRMSVEDYFDAYNQDPALRGRKILGMQILTLQGGGAGVLEGQIYNPQDGKTYDGFMEVLDEDRVRLNGCILWRSVCQGEDWTRVAPALAPDAEGTADRPAGPPN